MYRKSLSFPPSFRKTSLAIAIAATLALPLSAYAAPGDRVGAEFRVNTTTTSSQVSPTIALDADGDFVVAWSGYGPGDSDGIYAQRYNSAGLPQGGEFRVNTTTVGGQSSPTLALDADGDFVVAWQSDGQDGSQFGIYAQRFNNAGVPQDGEFQVNTFTDNNQTRPSVSLDADGDFVVVWQSYSQGESDISIHAQRFNNAGVPQSGEFGVIGGGGASFFPDVALDADGDFVVAFNSYTYTILAGRYNNANAPQDLIHVDSTTGSGLGIPAVALDADGDFVVTWSVESGIYAQRYNNAGLSQGGEFLVISTNGIAFSPDVAVDSDGDFVVAWQGNDGDNNGIYAQRYNNAGVPQGGAFRVSTTTADGRGGPAVALDADGDFIIAWQGADGDGSGIYAQRFAGPNAGVTCDGVPATRVGTNGPDTLIGTSGDDVIAGLDGDDVIHGRGGNDRLCGNHGWDRLLGGFGNDRLIGGRGIDTAEFGGNAGVGASLASGTAGGEGSDTLIDIENLTGTAVSDYLVGNGGPNILRGAGGSDILRGLGGNDRLFGGSANDNLDGGAGIDDVCDGQEGSSDQATNCETVRNVP